MIYKSMLLSALLLYAVSSTGQITGQVSSNSQPVPFASIAVKGTQLGTVSDSDGSFILNLPETGTFTLQVSAIGYTTAEKTLTIERRTTTIGVLITLEEAVNALESVVISGTMKPVSRMNSPVTVDSYSRTFLKANPAPSLFEGMQHINGVRPQVNCNVCNTGDIHINGLEGPYTMILIDGMPIVSGLSTVYGLMGIPQSMIERIEVIKGPAGTLYGSEAVGGLINVITVKPDQAQRLTTDLFMTSWAEINADVGMKYSLTKDLNLLTGLQYFNYQNPNDFNHDGFTDLTLQHRISLFAKAAIHGKHREDITLAGRYIAENRWGGQMNWNDKYWGSDSIYGEAIETRRWEFIGHLPILEHLSLQISGNLHDQNSAYGNTIFQAQQHIGFAQLLYSHTFGNHEILAGAASRLTYYDDNTPATRPSSNTLLPGLFVQNQWNLQQQQLLIGVRLDQHKVHGLIFTPRLNYKWLSADRTIALRWGLGNGYRVANVFTEDHAALTGARTVVFLEKLNPETSWNTNLNLTKSRYTSKGWFIHGELGLFYTYFFNRIIPDYTTDPNLIVYQNLDGFSVSKGINSSLEISMKNGLSAQIGSTMMKTTLSQDGKRMRQMLTESVQVVWTVSYPFKSGLKLDYTGNLIGPMKLPLLSELDERAPYSPWYSIQNVQLTQPFGTRWEIYGGIKNLLNYTPPANSIARAFDPFDKRVQFDTQGKVIATADNPQALTFDPSYVYAPNQGIRIFLGMRYTIR